MLGPLRKLWWTGQHKYLPVWAYFRHPAPPMCYALDDDSAGGLLSGDCSRTSGGWILKGLLDPDFYCSSSCSGLVGRRARPWYRRFHRRNLPKPASSRRVPDIFTTR